MYSKTRKSLCFLRKTSIKLTKLSCRNCYGIKMKAIQLLSCFVRRHVITSENSKKELAICTNEAEKVPWEVGSPAMQSFSRCDPRRSRGTFWWPPIVQILCGGTSLPHHSSPLRSILGSRTCPCRILSAIDSSVIFQLLIGKIYINIEFNALYYVSGTPSSKWLLPTTAVGLEEKPLQNEFNSEK